MMKNECLISSMHIIFKDNFCWWTHQNHIHLNNGETNLQLVPGTKL